MLLNSKYSETTEDLSSDHLTIPHYLLHQQQLAKILPLHFSHVQCPEANCHMNIFLEKYICIGSQWEIENAMSAKIMYGVLVSTDINCLWLEAV